MHTIVPPLHLLPNQTQRIQARTGLRLRVVSGRLWLTQPNASQDLFLGVGASIDLCQDNVVVGTDAPTDPRADGRSSYELLPLGAVEPGRARRFTAAWRLLPGVLLGVLPGVLRRWAGRTRAVDLAARGRLPAR